MILVFPQDHEPFSSHCKHDVAMCMAHCYEGLKHPYWFRFLYLIYFDKIQNYDNALVYQSGGSSWKILEKENDRVTQKEIRVSETDICKAAIKDRYVPFRVNSFHPMGNTQDNSEKRARETLLFLIGPKRYKDFLKKSYITAYNEKSGVTYQVLSGNFMTNAYYSGELIAKLCVQLDEKYPPTDQLITKYLMAMNDDQKLWDIGRTGASTLLIEDGSLDVLHRHYHSIFLEQAKSDYSMTLKEVYDICKSGETGIKSHEQQRLEFIDLYSTYYFLVDAMER